ncbi:MAG: hypothetical protein J7623_31125, partial [Chitinophaga sp.]|uniref:Calx-beta domain-containing protein n=1 Tax=Chitinophaga sp. TaxID=1869181 RepID=UPI001B10A4E2
MLLLSHPMKMIKQGMPRRIYALQLRAVYLIIAFFSISIGVNAQTFPLVINQGGGTNATNGLRIEINSNGTYAVFRKGKTESAKDINTGYLGARTHVAFNVDDYGIVGNLIDVSYSSISPLMGSGTAANPYRVSMIGKVDFYDASIDQTFPTTVIMTLTYITPNNYYTVDYTLYNENFYYTPHIYMEEFATMQDGNYNLPNPDNNTMQFGYIEGVSPNPSVIGFARSSDVHGTTATPGPLTHTYHAFDKFSSFSARNYNSRMTRVGVGSLNNDISVVDMADGIRKGLAVEVNCGQLETKYRAVGTRIGVSYGDNLTAPVVPVNATPVSTLSSPLTVSFERADTSGLEGADGDIHDPYNLRLKVTSGGIVKVPIYVKINLLPATAGDLRAAVLGTDFTFQGGYMIPAGTYATGDFIPLKNISIIGNNRLEYSRHFTLQLEQVPDNQLLLIDTSPSGITTCTYTIKDDEPKNIVLNTPANIKEGFIDSVRVALPPGVRASERTLVNLSIQSGTEATAGTDFTYNTTAYVEIDSNGVKIPVRAALDSIIEKDELIKLKADAVVMGEAQTFAQSLLLLDSTRLNPSLTTVSITSDPPASLKEPYDGKLTFSLPPHVTTDLPIGIKINKLPASTATDIVDYQLADTAVIIAGGHDTTATFKIIDDNKIEGTEHLNLSLTLTESVAHTALTNTPVALDILDKQLPMTAPVILNISSNSANEGTSPYVWAQLPSGLSTQIPIKVKFKPGGSSTALPGSYTFATDSVTILPNHVLSDTIYITNTANTIFDDTRDLVLVGNSPDNGILVKDSVKVTIVDMTDPSKKVLTLTADSLALKEGDSTRFKMSLPAGYRSSKPLTIALTTNATGTEAAVTDFKYLQTSITFPKDTAVFTTTNEVIKALTDQILEKDEQLNISGTVSGATGYTVVDAQLKINDATRRDATKTVITFTPPTAGMPENSTQQIGFKLPAGVTTEIPIKVSLAATGTATANTDYNLPVDTSFNTPSAAIELKVAGDILVEDDEAIHIIPSVSDLYNTTYIFSPATFDLTIKDAQYPFPAGDSVLLSCTPDSVNEGQSAVITATFPHGWKAGKAWTINLTKDVVQSTIASDRYTSFPGSITIPVNGTNGTTTIQTLANQVFSDEGALIIDGNKGDVKMPARSTDLYIKDNTDPTKKVLTIISDSAALTEGNSTRFKMSLPAGYHSAKPLTIALTTKAAGTEAAATDFQYLQTSITFPQDTSVFTTVSPVIKALVDQILEKDEQLNIAAAVTNSPGYTVTDVSLKINDATRRDATKT